MSKAQIWGEIILESGSPQTIWSAIFTKLQDVAENGSLNDLHHHVRDADRLLAESAWDLWQTYLEAAPRTSTALQAWWQQPSAAGRAILILDALSLRELPALLAGAATRHIEPTQVRVTGAEVPSDTDQFAQALGVASRSKLSLNKTPGTFVFSKDTYSEVLGIPFADCLGSIPNVPNLFLWHTWLDDQIHLHHVPPKQIYKDAPETLQGDAFWSLVNKLRQGRRLLITADHGYAESRQFTTEEDLEVTKALRDILGASRYRSATEAWSNQFMPPVVLTTNNHHIAVGQRKWKVQGGFPDLCHGGMSLLEVAVPFVELPPL